MTTKFSSSINESLASILLAEGILDLFEVTQVEEERTGKRDETGIEVRIIHLYLDERDRWKQEWHENLLLTVLPRAGVLMTFLSVIARLSQRRKTWKTQNSFQ